MVRSRPIAIILIAANLAWNGTAWADATAAQRIESRSYPSIFEAWAPAQNLASQDGTVAPFAAREKPVATEARHDLLIKNWQGFGLRSTQPYPGLATAFTGESIKSALQHRKRLLALNPNLIFLASVRYQSGLDNYLPVESPWWQRDSSGQRIAFNKDAEYGATHLLDLSSPQFQQIIAQQCRALVATGVFDGCFFDWWNPETPSRVDLIRTVRAVAGDAAILIANVNGRRPEKSAPYLNGVYMEGFGAYFFNDWKTAAANLLWAQTHLRPPVITALEGWYDRNDTLGRGNYALMREVTTLSLTHSDGYVLFGDPDPLPTPDHQHDWYAFWDKSLGRPIGPLAQSGPSGSFKREYANGTVIFNPPSNGIVSVHFAAEHTSAATGKRAQDYQINPGDGDIFLK
jgi:hypothetical protein